MALSNYDTQPRFVEQRYDPEASCDQLIRNIDRVCRERNISYYSLARMAEISQSSMHALMTGRTRPYIYTVYKICNALDISITELLENNECMDSEKSDMEEKEIIRAYRKLPKDGKMALKKILKMLNEIRYVDAQ